MNATEQFAGKNPVRWLSDSDESRELRCPVCLETRRNQALLETHSLADESVLTLFVCDACGSKFFDPPGVSGFSEIFNDETNFWKSYVEVVGGLWEMYWPAAVSTAKPGARLLDVGCGFGFTVDTWRRLRGEACGVELALYGRVGSEKLGVPIYADYLQNIPELRSQRFDVVYASEVIEHVPDPREFARLLSKYVAPDGVLCLTTPCADFVRKENENPGFVGTLSAGFHGFLIGTEEFRKIMAECGFAHVTVKSLGERMIAWASQRALQINDVLDMSGVRAEYLRYLDLILAERKDNDFVTDGIAYRHFRDNVMAKEFVSARTSLSRLEASLNEKYPGNLFDPQQTLEQVRATQTAAAYNERFPWFLPNLYYVRGFYAKSVERDEVAARGYFMASRQIAVHIALTYGALYVLEGLSFVAEAWHQEAVSAALTGDATVCEEWVAGILAHQDDFNPALGGGRFSLSQIELGYLESLWILGASKRLDPLRKTLDASLAYFGAGTAAQGGRRMVSAPTGPGGALAPEHRMLFQLRIAQACTQLDVHLQYVRPLLEHVLRIADAQHKLSEMGQSVAADARKRLAELSATPALSTGWNGGAAQKISYSFSASSKTGQKLR